MTSPTPPQVLIVGAGAIGAFFGAVLARAGAAVGVVSRSDFEAVRESGVRIQSPILGATTFKPAAVFRNVADAPSPDYLILSTKVLPELIASPRGIPPYKTSMALDLEAHRPIEIEAILGNAIRTARRLAINVPRLEMLYTLARTVERARTQTGVDEKKPPANPTARALG